MQNAPLFIGENVAKTFRLRAAPFLGSSRRVEVRALAGISFEIRRGEAFGIIGESGSGKTTLGLALADIDPPTAGTIRFLGTPLQDMSRVERIQFRHKVQMVFQDSGSALNPRRTVGAALRDSLRLGGLSRGQRSEALEKLLASVGLSLQHANRYPHQLSGGQRQRIGIARALAMNPEVLIADEPASALDVSVQAQIINLLLDLRRNLNLTIVLISHDIAIVHNISDRLAVMQAGQIIETARPTEIVTAPQHPYTKFLISAVPKGIEAQVADRGPGGMK
jgi:ABC-type oligopeptide transport system ATPase subunit